MNKNIFIPDQDSYELIVDKLSLGGKENLHILADFDKTLTKAFLKGEEFPSLISILRNDKSILGEEYAGKAYDLYNHYIKIEEDPSLTNEEKIPYMTEWWQKHQALLVESGLTRQHIEMAVDSGYLHFREGIEEFLSMLKSKDIPLVIISANGIGAESIRMFFEKHNLMSDNIHIISNELKFDSNGVTCGFAKKVIHSFNKSETVILEYPAIHKAIVDRKNVILMGDSLGDPDMINGFDSDCLLKIAFFNAKSLKNIDKSSELFAKYKEKYDILLLGNSDVKFVNELLVNIR